MAFGIQTYRGKLVTATDKAAADSLAPLYTLDLLIGKGPQTGTPSAGIWVYQTKAGGDQDLLSFDDARMRAYYDRMRQTGGVAEEQVGDPIRIALEGNYLANAEAEIRKLLVQYNHSCEVKVKVPRLKIQWGLPKEDVLRILNDGTFASTLKNIHEALHADFKWDPWLGKARRGVIGAAQHRQVHGRLGRQFSGTKPRGGGSL
jgi:hypothetical protein